MLAEKHILSDAESGQPAKRINIDNDDEDDMLDARIENFKKEAIWNQMREYKRLYIRSNKHGDKLKDQLSKCSAHARAIEACWNILVEDAKSLFMDLPSSSKSDESDLATQLPPIPLSNVGDFDAAIRERAAVTKQLLEKLLNRLPTSPSDLQQKCLNLTHEVQVNSQALLTLRAEVEELNQSLEKHSNDLIRAEKQLDRMRSKTICAIEGKNPDANNEARASKESTPKDNAQSSSGPTPNAETPIPGAPPKQITSDDLLKQKAETAREKEELQSMISNRLTEIDDLKAERLKLISQLDEFKLSIGTITEAQVIQSPFYRDLEAQNTSLTESLEREKTRMEEATKEADQIREKQAVWRTELENIAKTAAEQVQKQWAAREADLNRVRAERETLRVELSQLKSIGSEKRKSNEQMRVLLNSSKERMDALTSEARRAHMKELAVKGDTKSIELLAKLESDQQLLETLQSQLKSAEDTINTLQSEKPDPDVDVKINLKQAQDRISKLESMIGPDGNQELSDLVKQIEEKDKTIKSLEAQVKALEMAPEMLIKEVERLSSAWQTLQDQNSVKLFEQSNAEDKIAKLEAENNKNMNRWAALMRKQSALTNEKSVLSRLSENQERVIESLRVEQQENNTKIESAEKEVSQFRSETLNLKTQVEELTRQKAKATAQLEAMTKQQENTFALLKERTTLKDTEESQRRALEEKVEKLTKELESTKSSLAVTSNGSKNESTLVTMNEHLNQLLKCGACRLRFKNTILTRCMHLLCRECVDTRLETRQRKCPICSAAFGMADVSNIYF